MAVAISACGSSPKATPRTASALSDGLGAETTADAPDVSVEEKADFDELAGELAALPRPLSSADCQNALALANDAAAGHPDLPQAQFNLGTVLVECGQPAKANIIFEKLAGGSRPYAPAVSNLALGYFRTGDEARAVKTFERAIDIDKGVASISARINVSQIYIERMRLARNRSEKRRQLDRINGHLQRVLAVDGNNLEAYNLMAYANYQANRLEVAKLLCNQGIARANEIATGELQGQDLLEETAPAKARAGKRGRKSRKNVPTCPQRPDGLRGRKARVTPPS